MALGVERPVELIEGVSLGEAGHADPRQGIALHWPGGAAISTASAMGRMFSTNGSS